MVVIFGGEGAGPEGLVFRAGNEFLVVVAGGGAEALEGCLRGCEERVSSRGWQIGEVIKIEVGRVYG